MSGLTKKEVIELKKLELKDYFWFNIKVIEVGLATQFDDEDENATEYYPTRVRISRGIPSFVIYCEDEYEEGFEGELPLKINNGKIKGVMPKSKLPKNLGAEKGE